MNNKIEKIVYYKIDEMTVLAIRQVLADITDVDYSDRFQLTSEEIKSIHNYLDNIEIIDE